MSARFFAYQIIKFEDERTELDIDRKQFLVDALAKVILQGSVKDITAISHINWLCEINRIKATVRFMGDYETTVSFPNKEYDMKPIFSKGAV